MRSVRYAINAFLAINLLLACRTLADAEPQAAEEASQRPTLRAGILPGDFALDGRISEPAWSACDSISNLVTIEPREGAVPTARTIVRVLASPTELVVSAQCFDPDPAHIVSPSKARDAVLDEEDHVILVLDTFLDGRSGYVFAVNPSGARFDGLVTAHGEEINAQWDAVWEAKTSRDATGWCAEIRIPANSLGFKQGLTTWGFNVQRRVQRLQETSRWSGASRDYEVTQTSRAGLLADLPRFDLGAGLSIRPAAVGRLSKPSRLVAADEDEDLSLDVSKTLGPNLLSSLTVNTDFAETEVDARQIKLTRFPLFFPEKRTFFLAGADIFDFGLGLDEETMIPFFSRRIGLFGVEEEDQASIPIGIGGKVTGRAGNTNLGALVVGTRRVDRLTLVEEDLTLTVPKTTMGALRVRQNVLQESSVGMLATFGDPLGRSRSWMGGLDFTYRSSTFKEDQNLLVGLWGLLDDRAGLTGDKSAYGVRVDYPNDPVDINVTSMRIGSGFDPSLAFVPRNGVHIWDMSATFTPRPWWPGVREVTQELNVTLFNALNNDTWKSYSLSARPLDLLFKSGDGVSFAIEPEGDRPGDTFAISDGLDLPAGSFEWTRYLIGTRSAEKRRISAELQYQWGDYYNGDLKTLEGRLSARPFSFLTLEMTGERNTGRVEAVVEAGDLETVVPRRFKEQLVGARLELNVSPDLQFSTFTQYDTQSEELGTNNRLRWTFAPRGDLFIVHNHNLARGIGHRWEFVSRETPLKIEYSLSF